MFRPRIYQYPSSQGLEFAVAATAYRDGGNDLQAYLLRIDENGNENLQASALLGGPGDDTGLSLAIPPNRNVIGMVGFTQPTLGNQRDSAFFRDVAFWLIDDAGNQLRFSKWDGGDRDAAREVVMSPTGEFAIVGSTKSLKAATNDPSNIVFLKAGTDGVIDPSSVVWFGGTPCYDFARALIPLDKGGYAITGMFNREGTCQSSLENDVFVLGVTETGQVDWDFEAYGFPQNDERGNNMIRALDGDLVIIAKNRGNFDPNTNSYTGDQTSFLIKINQR